MLGGARPSCSKDQGEGTGSPSIPCGPGSGGPGLGPGTRKPPGAAVPGSSAEAGTAARRPWSLPGQRSCGAGTGREGSGAVLGDAAPEDAQLPHPPVGRRLLTSSPAACLVVAMTTAGRLCAPQASFKRAGPSWFRFLCPAALLPVLCVSASLGSPLLTPPPNLLHVSCFLPGPPWTGASCIWFSTTLSYNTAVDVPLSVTEIP